jgi:hypothetical protein
MLAKQLPEPVLAVFRQGRTAEFTTLNKSGAPVTWPTLPFFDEATDRFFITTSIAFPEKVYSVRRTPRVALHYSDPTGSGLVAPPIVLIQGDAVAPDEIHTEIAGFEPQLREVFRRQPSSQLYSANFLTRYLFDWYYMRLTITITPRRILWWPGGDQSQLPLSLEVVQPDAVTGKEGTHVE